MNNICEFYYHFQDFAVIEKNIKLLLHHFLVDAGGMEEGLQLWPIKMQSNDSQKAVV